MLGSLVDWTVPTLEGDLVRLEPLASEHEEGLWDASRDERTWRWLSVLQPQTRQEMHDYVEAALANMAAAEEFPLTTIRRQDGRVVGSTRFLALRPEHLSIEIGWTWLHPDVWASGINIEAKLLMLEHAFERLGCLRVELKTDARNERSRAAMAAPGSSAPARTSVGQRTFAASSRRSKSRSPLRSQFAASAVFIAMRATTSGGSGFRVYSGTQTRIYSANEASVGSAKYRAATSPAS